MQKLHLSQADEVRVCAWDVSGMCVYVCVCVRVIEREIEREIKKNIDVFEPKYLYIYVCICTSHPPPSLLRCVCVCVCGDVYLPSICDA